MDYRKRVLNHEGLVQLIRYGCVAAIAWVIDFGLFVWLTRSLDFHYAVAATISFTVSMLVNGYLTIVWAFASQDKKTLKLIMVLSCVGLVGLLLNIIILWGFIDVWKWNQIVSKVLTTVLVFLWSFLARRYIFRQSDPAGLTAEE